MQNIDVIESKEYKDGDLESKLNSSKEWNKLTELQKRIVYLHWNRPELSKNMMAKELNCSVQTIYNFFTTPVYALLSLEIDRLDMRELRQLAVKSLKECMQGSNFTVKLAAAVRVLETEGLLHDSPALEKEREYKVVWADKPVEKLNGLENQLPAP